MKKKKDSRENPWADVRHYDSAYRKNNDLFKQTTLVESITYWKQGQIY